MTAVSDLLDACAALHHHLCPRQVLGVRMGLLAGRRLGIELPQSDKRLLAIVETDGCATSGIAVATNCWVRHRTMRIEDYGKVAATFVEVSSGRAVRIAPRSPARAAALSAAPEARNDWEAMLLGYQRLADDDLLVVQPVRLATPVERIISRPGLHIQCAVCGEEIMNEREVVRDGQVLCQACAGPAYYRTVAAAHVDGHGRGARR